jgi:hypothetical protein
MEQATSSEAGCDQADPVQTYQLWMESVLSLNEATAGEAMVMAWRDEWKAPE